LFWFGFGVSAHRFRKRVSSFTLTDYVRLPADMTLETFADLCRKSSMGGKNRSESFSPQRRKEGAKEFLDAESHKGEKLNV
jgi:hypothetical protein